MKRMISILLTAALLLSCLPSVGLATEQQAQMQTVAEETQPEQTVVEETQPQQAQTQTPAAGALLAAGNCGEHVTWSLDDTGILTIAGTGPMADYPNDNQPWKDVAESVTTIRVEPGVTLIGKRAFIRMDTVQSVSLPSTLERIGENAFYGCVGMKEVNLPEGLKRIGDGAFHSCSGLTSVIFPASLTYLDYNAYWGCSSLTELTIPATLTTIRGGTFKDCSGLTKVTIEEGVTGEELGFSGCTGLTEVTIPSSMTVIASSMFSGCTNLTKVNFPEVITEVGGFAFKGCVSLTQLELPDTVTEIGQQVFENCFALTSITVPAGVRTIPYAAFRYCTGLDSVTISGRVTRINKEAFLGCVNLENVYYTDTQAQWEKIVKEASNENLTGATIHCAETHTHILTNYAAKDPTCTAYGWEAYEKCAICNYTTYAQTPATGHSHENQVVAPTCTEQGYTLYTCHCGDTKKDTFVAALDHDYSVEVVKPTYGKLGYTHYDCKRCDDAYDTDYVDRLDVPAPQVHMEVDSISGRPTLFWNYLGDGIYYEIYRATKKTGKYTLVSKVIEDVDWEDPKATVGTTYYYKVRAVCTEQTDWCSAYSEILSAKPVCGIPELTVDVNRTTGKPLLKWNKVSGAKKYEIYRMDEHGNNKKLTTTTKLTYTDTKATTGRYYAYYLRALGSSSAYHSEYCEPVVTLCFMGAPTLTATTDAATGKPKLSWTSVKGTQFYIVCRVEPEGSWENEDDIAVFPLEERTFVDETAKIGIKYRYAIIAAKDDGETSSYFSAEKAVTCVYPRPVVRTALDGNGKPVLSWQKVDGAENYKLYRSTKSGSGYKVIATLDVDTLQYTDTSVAAGKTYYYKLTAAGQGVESAMTSYQKITGKCAIPELTVKTGSAGKPVLSWNKISGAKKYEIHRSVDGGAFKKLTTTTKLTYTDTKATAGAECAYKVKALGSRSSYNGSFSKTGKSIVVCAAPSLTAKIDIASGKASLSWKKVTGAASYAIYRSVNDGEFILADTVAGTSYLDTAIPSDTKCSYYVVTLGRDRVFDSIPSAVKTLAVTLGQPKIKGSVNTNGRPTLTWGAVADARGYHVYRSTSSSKNYTVIGTATECNFTDEAATGGKTYYYKVTALGVNTEGPQSSYAKLTAKCAAPVIGLEVNKDGKPALSWQKVDGAKKYEIHRSIDGGTFKKLTTTTKLTYTETKAEAGKTYAYKIKALGSKSTYNSQFSVSLSCRATLGTPQVTVTADPATGYPLVTWTEVPGVEWYLVVRNGEDPIATVDGLQYLDRDVVLGKTYTYHVIAEGDYGEDGWEPEEDEDNQITVAPGQPLLTANNGYSQRGYLSWEYMEGATEYAIYRSTKKDSGYTRIGSTTINRYMDMTGVELKPYYYKIAALVGEAEGMQSNPVQMNGIRTYTPHNTDPNRFVVVGSNWENDLIWWEITSDGVLTISGVGAMRNGSNYPWKKHEDYFHKVVIDDGVTSVIGFSGLKQITEVQLGKHVTLVDNFAFYGCEKLSNVVMSTNLETIAEDAFAGCTSLEKLVFPENCKLRTIETGAFGGSGLKEFVAPENLETIGDEAFGYCRSLETVILENKVQSVGVKAFEECRTLKRLVLGSSLKTVAYDAFYDCVTLQTLELYSQSVTTSFQNYAFLKKVILGGERTTTGSFSQCKALEEVILMDGIQTIDRNAFWLCSNLKQITIPETVTEIGRDALRGTGIEKLTIPASVTKIDAYAFTGNALKEITFLGDYTPDLSKSCLQETTVVVYYPKDNPTWTQEVRDSFSGTLTWIAQ